MGSTRRRVDSDCSCLSVVRVAHGMFAGALQENGPLVLAHFFPDDRARGAALDANQG